jgi:hypothetical protein
VLIAVSPRDGITAPAIGFDMRPLRLSTARPPPVVLREIGFFFLAATLGDDVPISIDVAAGVPLPLLLLPFLLLLVPLLVPFNDCFFFVPFFDAYVAGALYSATATDDDTVAPPLLPHIEVLLALVGAPNPKPNVDAVVLLLLLLSLSSSSPLVVEPFINDDISSSPSSTFPSSSLARSG